MRYQGQDFGKIPCTKFLNGGNVFHQKSAAGSGEKAGTGPAPLMQLHTTQLTQCWVLASQTGRLAGGAREHFHNLLNTNLLS